MSDLKEIIQMKEFEKNPQKAIFNLLKSFREEVKDTIGTAIKDIKQDTTEKISKLEKKVDDSSQKIESELKKKLEEELNYEIDEEKIRGQKGDSPTESELFALIKPLIKDPTPGKNGEPGKTPTKKELLILIKPLIKPGKDGETPSDTKILSLINKLLPKIKEIEGEMVVEKINALEITPKKQIEKEHIKDLVDSLKTMNENIREIRKQKGGGSGGGGGDIIYMEDLSSQTNGVTLTFTVPKHRKSIMVVGSDFPSFLFLNNGFTVNANKNQITLTVANAPSQGSQLGFQYVK